MLEGGDKALGDLQGKVVLVDFWATWCEPCLEAMPRLQKLYSAYSAKGFDVWGVSIDEDKDRVEKIKKMVDKMDIFLSHLCRYENRRPLGISLR